MTLDAVQPSITQLMDRISRFWISDEVILYIGKATELSTRLSDYYRTSVGKRSPHSGGFFLKLLSNLDQLWVHYAECNDPESVEDKMIRRFCENVSQGSRGALHDPAHPFPFANLEWPKGIFKAHGLRDVREDRRKRSSTNGKPKSVIRTPMVAPAAEENYPTQRVTATDLDRAVRYGLPRGRVAGRALCLHSLKPPSAMAYPVPNRESARLFAP